MKHQELEVQLLIVIVKRDTILITKNVKYVQYNVKLAQIQIVVLHANLTEYLKIRHNASVRMVIMKQNKHYVNYAVINAAHAKMML